MKNFPDKTLTVVVLAMAMAMAMAFTSAAAHGSGEERDIVSGLPRSYEPSRILGHADDVAVTILRPTPADGTGAPVRYLVATYSDRETTVEDFERMMPGDNSDGTWQVILQSHNRIHWLSGSCTLDSEQFRSVYAGALEYVESNDSPVQSANLCQCDSPCQRIMVDR